ncbi:signal transduction histidine kinase [Nakamurella sp. UYEF19]|uniref:sensor histidine kinase n=1 Tax=Nakamurella sp. UYEF19 TaxID=1756392 RepID=UPI0033934CBE
MTRRLVLALVALTAAVAIALAVPLVIMVDRDQRAAFVSRLQLDALITSAQLSMQSEALWAGTVATDAARTNARIVIVRPDLSLAADSNLSALDRVFDRPEIRRALSGQLASDTRTSITLGGTLRYVAAPILQHGEVMAAVRFSLPEDVVDDMVARTGRSLALFIASVISAAALVAWLLARSLAAPLHRLAGVAGRLPANLSLRGDEDHGPAEVRQVAAALNATAGHLDELVTRQQRVAADASHHLRTPLTGIRLRLEAIEDLTQDPAVRNNAAAAVAEVDRLARRLDQVLALALSDSGPASSSVQASDIVRGRVATWQTTANEDSIQLDADVTDGLLIQAPIGVLDRVIDELIGNALRYANRRVGVRLARNGAAAVTLTVADDGPGLASEEREIVFERFTRGTQAVPGGSGLGLALVRDSARTAGGEAKAEESPAGGLQIVTTWPAPVHHSPPGSRTDGAPLHHA